MRGKPKSIAAAPTRRLAVFRISALLIAEQRLTSAVLPAFLKADLPVAFRARGLPVLPPELSLVGRLNVEVLHLRTQLMLQSVRAVSWPSWYSIRRLTPDTSPLTEARGDETGAMLRSPA